MSQHEPYTCSLAIMICNNSVDTNTIIHLDSMIGIVMIWNGDTLFDGCYSTVICVCIESLHR